MFDLSAKFNTFYREHVVLPQEDQSKLYELARKNIKRLKEGLKEYNSEYGTEHEIVDSCVQGSVEMSTVVQNERNNYDIDVAIVLSHETISTKGPLATRKMIAEALCRKVKNFNTQPKVKTSCIRVYYADGYHIDFAIYRKRFDIIANSWKYEHAGSVWSERELRAISEWFKEKNDESNGKLRKVVRLSKMFCSSREEWKNMPSGLLQTILCQECLATEYDRIDELFYYTMENIVQRIENDNSVKAPVDNNRDLTPRESDLQKMTNWKNRLKSKLRDLAILHDVNCDYNDAIQVWFGFFNHDYWEEQIIEEYTLVSSKRQHSVINFTDTEQHIEDNFSINLVYSCRISCRVSGNGWHLQPLSSFYQKTRNYLPPNFKVHCEMVYTDCPKPYEIYWKVKNAGPEAQRRNRIRGQIEKRGRSIIEPTQFYGNHYIECYIVQDNVCVARAHQDINIGGR